MIPFKEAILRTFENTPDDNTKGRKAIFFYPLRTQKETRAFARAIQRNGLSIEQLCKELNETFVNFKLWESKKGAPLVGTCLMKIVNSYIESVYVCAGEQGCKSVQLDPIKLEQGNKVQNFDKNQKIVSHNLNKTKPEVEKIKIEVLNKHFHGNGVSPMSNNLAEIISNKSSKGIERDFDKSCNLNFVSVQKPLMSNPNVTQLNIVDSGSEKVDFLKKQAKNNSKIQALIDKFNRLSRKEAPKDKELEKKDLSISKTNISQLEKDSIKVVNKLSASHFDSHKGENVTSLVSNGDFKSIFNQAKDHKSEKFFVSHGQLGLSCKQVEKISSGCDKRGAIPDVGPQPKTSIFSFNKEKHSQRIHPEISEKGKNFFTWSEYKKNTATWDDKPLSKVFNRFIPGRNDNNCYKIAQNKESKDNANSQIRANLGLKFGISVASIISKFNKLQERM